MAEPVRHRQTKAAATDMFDLKPPRHISTLRLSVYGTALSPNLLRRRRELPIPACVSDARSLDYLDTNLLVIAKLA